MTETTPACAKAKNIIVSVVILTCNRISILSELLANVEGQTFPHFEIIVVDNNSSDGTTEFLKQNYPSVITITLPENVGCGGRNIGIRQAKGNIIVTIDDDILFRSKDALATIAHLFNQKKADVINFSVLDFFTKKMASFNWYHPRDMDLFSDQEFETCYISEGAVAFDKKIFDSVGYYHEAYFLGHEGIDLALRILEHGFKIIYSPDIQVLHKHSKRQRASWRGTYYDTRNYIWLHIRNYPAGLLIMKSFYKLVSTFVFAVSRGQLYWYMKAVKDALLGIPEQVKQRKPVHQDTLDRLAEINRQKPNLLYQIKNFQRRGKERNY